MAAHNLTLEKLVAEAQQLSTQDRVRLIQRVAETLLPTAQPGKGRLLQYGEFTGPKMSTEEDIAIAEWRLSEHDLDG